MIQRDIAAAVAHSHDVIIIGGGIHGAALALQAAEAGLAPQLFEAHDFGGGATWNSLRILHGGLRYLQSGDLPRFFQSVADRHWFMKRFPGLVRPLPCLMPLYGDGLRRANVMRVALLANDLLSAGKNRGIAEELQLPPGRLLDCAATLERFPHARREGLEGGALWYDGFMPSTERIVMEILHRASALGARLANYANVECLRVEGGRICGVCVRDTESSTILNVDAPVVIGCMGGSVSRFAADRGACVSHSFPMSLAINLLLDIEPPSECAVAVSSPRPGAQAYFLLPQGSRMLAGTAHFSRSDTQAAVPSEREIATFLDAIGAALPTMRLSTRHVLRVFSGLLPATVAGSAIPAKREMITDYGTRGGPKGFYSVAGVKFTTARSVASKALRAAFPQRRSEIEDQNTASSLSHGDERLLLDYEAFLRADPERAGILIRRIIDEESAHDPDDIVMRRANWGANARDLSLLRSRVAEYFQQGGARIALNGLSEQGP